MRLRKFGLCAALLLPTFALAWNAEGHRQIADIAWTKLTPRTKSALLTILSKGDPKFSAPTGDEAAAREAFRQLATMPDVIKGDRTTAYEPLIAPNNARWLPEADPKDREQELCKTWHYYDVPLRYTGAEPSVSISNADNALNYAVDSLKKLGSGGGIESSWWLGWIEHITGDVHQPLHCVSNYEIDHDKGDAGGNSVKLGLNGRNGRPLALHAFWDEAIDHAKAADAAGRGSTSIEATTLRWEKDASLQPKADQVNVTDPMKWILEGAKIADTQVYTPEIKNGAVPSEGYERAQEAIARKQAVLGGYRLAKVLNAIFDPQK